MGGVGAEHFVIAMLYVNLFSAITTESALWPAIITAVAAIVGSSTFNGWLTRKKVQQVITIVDGPLTNAINGEAEARAELAEMAMTYAQMTGKPEDLKKAILAAAESLNANAVMKNREDGKEQRAKEAAQTQ